MSMLPEAIVMATLAHAHALDKSGVPYILHPLAVMLDPSLTTEEEQICAVLHDVIEDTDVQNEDILQAFGEETLLNVQGCSRAWINRTTSELIFKHPGLSEDYRKETYGEFIDRAALRPVSRLVKIADLRHNSSPVRMAALPPEMKDISKRYQRALLQLGVSVEVRD